MSLASAVALRGYGAQEGAFAPPAMSLRSRGGDGARSERAGRDLTAMGDELQQSRHREIGRAHEDQAERHVCSVFLTRHFGV